MIDRRETARVSSARAWSTMIAFAVACGGNNAPAANAHQANTPPSAPPAMQHTADTTPPAGAMGDAIRRGHALLAATRDSLPAHVGASLRCLSCHLDDGRRAQGLSLVGAYTRYPQVRARRARVDLIEDRVNDCFIRSLNGKPIDTGGSDMHDIVAYLWWLSRGVAVGDTIPSQGAQAVATLDADTARGVLVYASTCARCHGANGAGAAAPALWGAGSYNIGAGMARYRVNALFVLHNMPYDRAVTLTPQQALDVARFIDTRPRPDLAGKENDFPKGNRPADVPYATHSSAH